MRRNFLNNRHFTSPGPAADKDPRVSATAENNSSPNGTNRRAARLTTVLCSAL
jgi:hypothetical protein